MLHSQILNVLPRRVLASLWSAQETRLSLSSLTKEGTNSQGPAAITPNFLCTELPVRHTHILRLLSTLSHESLESPIIKNVAHSYLYDICTLLHPSLKSTSPKAFSKVLSRIRTSHATNLIRLKYALISNQTKSTAALMENINIISCGIHNLIDQYLSWDFNHAQKLCPEEVAVQAIHDATAALANAFGPEQKIPKIEIRNHINKRKDNGFVYVPSILHRIIYELSLLSLKAQTLFNKEDTNSSWLKHQWRKQVLRAQTLNRSLVSLHIFDGPTSVGFRLDSSAPLLEQDLLPSIPRDPLGFPVCSSLLSSTSNSSIDSKMTSSPWIEWAAFSGWQSAKTLASHWGGNLDVVSIDGLGSTIYLALDKDESLLERYPSRMALAASAQSMLLQSRRTSAMSADYNLSIQSASTQVDAFLYAISGPQQPTFVNRTPLYHHHSVSLSAAIGHA